MKQLCLFTFILFAAFYSSAQDCKNYYFMTNNAKVQMTMYDKDYVRFLVEISRG